MAIDLHLHTAASGDGELSPQAIIHLAQENNLRTVAITDHDTVDNVAAAIHWGQNFGIEVIPGCEFSAGHQGKWLHILGYYIDYEDPAIREWCTSILAKRQAIVNLQIDKLQAAGFYLDKDMLLANNPQPMPLAFAQAVFSDPRNKDNQLLNEYRKKDNYLVRFALDWLASGKPYNIPVELPAVEQVINLIRKSGGVPVLAHPAATLTPGEDKVLYDLVAMGLMGIEAFTTWHTAMQADYYYRFCNRHNLIFTCGSDFHGRSKPHIRIGQVTNNDYQIVNRLKQAASAVKKRML